MHRLLWVAALVGGIALGAVWPDRYYWEMATCPTGAGSNCVSAQSCSAGSCTTSAPSTATQGLATDGISAFQLTICAASGQTLSGAGSMVAYVYRYSNALWARAPSMDQPVPASCASNRCCTFSDMETGSQSDRVYFAASAVTVSSGATLDAMLDGQTWSGSH